MKPVLHGRPASQHGYSLVELLTVVAIIGILSLVTVPNFISLYQSSRVKGVARTFTSDVRNVRQLAIAGNQRTRVAFDATGKTFTTFREVRDFTTNTTSWVAIKTGSLGEVVNFNNTVFIDRADATGDNGRPDIIFLPNGTIDTTGIPSAQLPPWLEMRTNVRVPKQTYRLTFTPAGAITVS
ncbi:MAG TPA: prepilin-type N-terminal cleavage/methylation domain-containing protein [Thermoanaerobaculia bacterium]|jgi:prepilin-type N-terminal cleavage/methylation domain-containing protein